MSSLKRKFQTVDLMNAGVLTLENGRVSGVNVVAGRLLEQGVLLAQVDQRLALLDNNHEFEQALAQAQAENKSCEFYRAHEGKHGGFLVQVHYEAPQHPMAPHLHLICIFQLGHSNGLPENVFSSFCRLFGLSPAEGRVVRAILEGVDVTEYALEADIQPDTARKQLKSAQGKLKMKDQKQLLRSYMQYAAAHQFIVQM
ncbi:helix-turn-helix transcriptional regulator [Pseudovibrio sp. SCP19]|uniref:helix-turn-helix transcriptional regulator n=1 Tax=Pseudovibrio sp. SCP19 TaxID=3141374 RepID=UPI00333B9F37